MTISMKKRRKLTSQIFDFWKFITEIFAKHVERFSKIMKLRKIRKLPIFMAICPPETVTYGKSKSSHENQHEKIKKMYISDFWFLKIHHRDICKTCWEIFENHEIMKNKKIAHFLGHFSPRNSKIWQIKIISWRSAWKNEENLHLRFLIFENSSQRYLQNMLRDFWKSRNYEK